MKSAIIWNEFETISYFIVDEDWTRFQGVYINSLKNEKLQKELGAKVYSEEGIFQPAKIDISDFVVEIREGAKLVECGFIP